MRDLREVNNIAGDIAIYQDKPNSRLFQSIVLRMTPYVYYFPTFAFKTSDEDFLSEFYTSFYTKIERVILHYDSKKAEFSTYLSAVLRNHYIYSCQQKKKKQDDQTLYQEEQAALGWENLVARNPTCSDDKREKLIGKIFRDLSKPFQYLVIKLYYIDFFDEGDLLLLQSYLGKSYAECLRRLEKLYSDVLKKAQKQVKIEEGLQRTHKSILKLQRAVFDTHNGNLTTEYKEKIKQLRQRQQNAVEQYAKIRKYPSYKVVAEVVDADTITVTNIITYFKNKKQKYLSRLGWN